MLFSWNLNSDLFMRSTPKQAPSFGPAAELHCGCLPVCFLLYLCKKRSVSVPGSNTYVCVVTVLAPDLPAGGASSVSGKYKTLGALSTHSHDAAVVNEYAIATRGRGVFISLNLL